MKHILLGFTLVLALVGCSDPTEASNGASKYVGTWSNERSGRGLKLVIDQDGHNFTVKEPSAKTNFVLGASVVEVADCYLNAKIGIGPKIFLFNEG
ncbi:lipocalin/fatty acid-binding family protein [Pseudomonas sivasensis]|uniref:Lipoprotein n=1 Tax=Pseudomonas sivasensis TaxID=1880678 RepID=A0ABW8E4K3_9PSED